MRNLDPFNVTLKPIYQGNTWDGLTDCAIEDDGTETADALELVEMGWEDENGTEGLRLTSATVDNDPPTITIDNAAAWKFTVLPIAVFPLAVGKWKWSIKTTDSAGRSKTYASGTKEVIHDPT